REGAAVAVGLGGTAGGDGVVDLRGEHDALPAVAGGLGEPAADDLLGASGVAGPAVDVGGVEEVDAQFQRAVHDGEAVGLAGLGAEVHGAQADRADEHAAAAEV